MTPRATHTLRCAAQAAVARASTLRNHPEAAQASLLALAQAGAEVARLALETGISDRLPVELRAFVVNAGRPVPLVTLMERPTSEWIVGAPAEPMLDGGFRRWRGCSAPLPVRAMHRR